MTTSTTPAAVAASNSNDVDNAPPIIQQPTQKQSLFQTATSQRLRPFVIISTSYLLFTITDGALRMIVLLHAYTKNFSALQVALMFTLYELAGVVTNLLAGLLGAKWGIRRTLISGLFLQLFSYALLFGWQDDWTKAQAIIYVTVAQMFAGVAKDLTKLGGKTVTKLVTPEERQSQLFKLVSLLTGWKNSLKGVGYFAGSALLQVDTTQWWGGGGDGGSDGADASNNRSYELALSVMMGLVVLALPWAVWGLDNDLGTAKSQNASWKDVVSTKNPNLNILSAARLFLFASRDFWFEVPLPFFLRSPGCDGLGVDPCETDADCAAGAMCATAAATAEALVGGAGAGGSSVCQNINIGGGCGGIGLDRVLVGAFLGGYIILYGQVQSWTPQLVTGPLNQTPPNKLTEVMWGAFNCVPTLVAAFVLQFDPSFRDHDVPVMTSWMVVIIVSFAIIFAVNSSIHSFLVVNYAEKDKVAVSVGFYYMSNALGRLFGTLGSGLLYTYVGETINALSGNDAVAGLAACFFAGTCSSLLAALITMRIDDNKAGLKCGPCTIVGVEEEEEKEEEEDKEDEYEAQKYKSQRDLEDTTEEMLQPHSNSNSNSSAEYPPAQQEVYT